LLVAKRKTKPSIVDCKLWELNAFFQERILPPKDKVQTEKITLQKLSSAKMKTLSSHKILLQGKKSKELLEAHTLQVSNWTQIHLTNRFIILEAKVPTKTKITSTIPWYPRTFFSAKMETLSIYKIFLLETGPLWANGSESSIKTKLQAPSHDNPTRNRHAKQCSTRG